MQNHRRRADRDGDQNIQPRAREHQTDDRHDPECGQHDAVVHHAIEQDDRLVAEEVEEKPEREDHRENYHRDRVVNQAEEEKQKHDHGVVHAEVAEIAFEASGQVCEALWDGVGGRVGQELAPLAACGVDRLGARLDAVEHSGIAAGVRWQAAVCGGRRHWALTMDREKP